MRRIVTLILLVLLLGTSCTKKEYPKSMALNDVEFFLKATIDNKDYLYQAGIDNYRAYPTYSQSANGLYSFSGEFKLTDCGVNCPSSIKIQINDSKLVAQSAPSNINNTTFTGQLNYKTLANQVKFKSGFNKNAETYFWEFGDGETSTEANPTHTYKNKGKYKTRLTISDSNKCQSTIKGELKLGYYDSSSYVNIKSTVLSSKVLNFQAQIINAKTPLTYLWDFGDGKTSTNAAPIHVYAIEGSYPVTLRIIDVNNDESYAYYNAVTLNDKSSCAANYSVDFINAITGLSGNDFLQVSVTWVDEAGNLFLSKNAIQPAISEFQIVSIEDYENDENGNRIKKIKIRFACMLQGSLRKVAIKNAEAVIAIAYK
jgi:PKD repeat protein